MEKLFVKTYILIVFSILAAYSNYQGSFKYLCVSAPPPKVLIIEFRVGLRNCS
jgi:hypothetical protein